MQLGIPGRQIFGTPQAPKPGLIKPGLIKPGLIKLGLIKPGLIKPGLIWVAVKIMVLFWVPQILGAVVC